MKTDEIAKEITLKVLDHNNETSHFPRTSEQNEILAKEVSKFYKTVYKAVNEAKNDEFEDIHIGNSN